MNMPVRTLLALTCALSLMTVTLAHAASHTAAPIQADAAAAMSEGEVRKINKETERITIRHGELKNLDMPPMTMIFRVADPAMLEQVSAGEKINFVAEKIDGKFTVMQLEVKK